MAMQIKQLLPTAQTYSQFLYLKLCKIKYTTQKKVCHENLAYGR